MPMVTRSKTRVLKQKAQEDARRLEKAKRLQRNVVLVESTQKERRSLRSSHAKATIIAWEKAVFLFRGSFNPVVMFLLLNEKMRETGNPWLLTKDGCSPSSFKADLQKKEHLILYHAWRNWRATVPLPN